MNKYEAVAKTADDAIEEILSKMNVGIDELNLEIEEANKMFGLIKQVKVTATLKSQANVNDLNKSEVKKQDEKIKEEKAQEDSNKINNKETNIEQENEDSFANPELISDPEKVIRDFLGHIGKNTNCISEVKVNVESNIVRIDISGEDVSLLIGKHGRTLDAIRSLLSLMINRGRAKDDLKRVLLDVEGYRKKRDNSLERLARSTATKVIKTGKEVAMEPMNPYERRIIHSVLQRNKLVSTRSEGEEPSRYVVVFLK